MKDGLKFPAHMTDSQRLDAARTTLGLDANHSAMHAPTTLRQAIRDIMARGMFCDQHAMADLIKASGQLDVAASALRVNPA